MAKARETNNPFEKFHPSTGVQGSRKIESSTQPSSKPSKQIKKSDLNTNDCNQSDDDSGPPAPGGPNYNSAFSLETDTVLRSLGNYDLKYNSSFKKSFYDSGNQINQSILNFDNIRKFTSKPESNNNEKKTKRDFKKTANFPPANRTHTFQFSDYNNSTHNKPLTEKRKELDKELEKRKKERNEQDLNFMKNNSKLNNSGQKQESVIKDNYLNENENVTINENTLLASNTFMTENTQKYVLQFIEEFNKTKNKKNDMELCPKCKQKLDNNYKYSSCGHNVCSKCCEKLEIKLCQSFDTNNKIVACHEVNQNISHRVCPVCSQRFRQIKLTDKYVVFCLGKKVTSYISHNGGYANVFLIFIGTGKTIKFDHVTWEKNSKIIEHLNKLSKDEYTLLVQDPILVNKWATAVMIDFFKKSLNVILL